MATLTVQALTDAGLDPTLTAAGAAGDEFDNAGDQTLVVVNNAAAGTRTVTFTAQRECSQGFDHDQAVVVQATSEVLIGPFGKHRFNDANNRVQMSYDDETSVTVAAVRMEDPPTG